MSRRKRYSQRELSMINDIKTLIENKDFLAVQVVKVKWNFTFVLEEMIMATSSKELGCPFDEVSTINKQAV